MPGAEVGRTGTVAALRARLARLVGNEVARGPALSFGLKLGMSALNLVMLTLIARSMTPHEFGVFAFWFNALAFLAVAAGLGQEKLILRSWNEYHANGAWGLARGALLFGSRVSALGALIVAAAVIAAGYLAGSDPWLVGAGAGYLVVQTLFIFSAHVNRAMVGILGGDVHEMTWRLVVIAATLLALVTQAEMQASDYFLAATVGVAIGLAFQVALAWRHLPPQVRAAPAKTRPRLWSLRSVRMALGANLEAASQYLEVIAVGLVLSPSAAGGYFVATRLANIFSMITSGLYSYTARQIPREHYRGGSAALGPTLRRISLFTSVPVAIGLVAILIGGKLMLSLFGPNFVGEYPVLAILSVGTALVAFAGPAPTLLMLTGHEGTYSALLAASLALRLTALLVLAFLFGSLGAAAASAVTAVLGAIALNVACRRKAGLDPSIGPLLT